MHIQTFCFNPIQVNTYLLWDDDKNALIIDPGCFTDKEKQTLEQFIHANGLNLKSILNTHLHFDHVLGNAFIEKIFSVSSQAHRDDLFLLNHLSVHARLFGIQTNEICNKPASLLEDDTCVDIGKISLRVWLAPGHSPGSLVFYNKAAHCLFSGDVLFRESVGRSDLQGGNGSILAASLQKLMTLPDDTIVYPGHGPKTTIGHEKKHNPFI